MDISGGINRTVNFYTADTGNKLNLTASENKIYGADMFSSGFGIKEAEKTEQKKASVHKKRRKNRRLNTLDTDFLPDETAIDPAEATEDNLETNFFTAKKKNHIFEKIARAADYFFTSAPLINYFYLKKKEQKLHAAAEKLLDLVQSTDELMNTAVPYGENAGYYDNIAKNLTDAAGVIGSANKDF